MSQKSFILYHDQFELIKQLSKEQRGELFTAIYQYEMSGAYDELDKFTNLVMISIKQSLDRNRNKYNNIVERNKINGIKGGRPSKNPEEPKKPSGLFGNPEKPKKADSDRVSVSNNDNINDINIYAHEAETFYNHYPLKKSKKKAIEVFISICKKSKFTKEQAKEFTNKCVLAIDSQKTEKEISAKYNLFVAEWKHPTTWLNQHCWNDGINTEEQIKQYAIETGKYKLTFAEKLQKCSGEEACPDYQGF